MCPEAELFGAGVDEHVRGSLPGDAQVSGGALSVRVGSAVVDDDEPSEPAVAKDFAADRVEHVDGAESGAEQAELFRSVGWVRRGVVRDDDDGGATGETDGAVQAADADGSAAAADVPEQGVR